MQKNHYKNEEKHNVQDMLEKSRLAPEIIDQIEKVFISAKPCEGIDISLIQENTIRLLEELPVPDAKIAINEFVQRLVMAPEKICKSKSGYLRGVCLKYWKTGRAATKQRMAQQYRNGEITNKRKFVQDFIDHCFTPGSKLSLAMVDATVRRKLFQLSPLDALDVVFEFISAVTFRTAKIRNINAYIMSMIKKAESFGHMKTLNEILYRQKYHPPHNNHQQHNEPKRRSSNPTQPWFGNNNNQQARKAYAPPHEADDMHRIPTPEQARSPSSIHSPTQNRQATTLCDKKPFKSPSTNNSPPKMPWAAPSDSLFSHPNPTQNFSYVSGSENEPSSENPDHSTGDSSSGGSSPQTPVIINKTSEETITSQANEIKVLRKKVSELETKLSRYEFEEYSEDTHSGESYSAQTRTPTSENVEQSDLYNTVFTFDKYAGFDSFYPGTPSTGFNSPRSRPRQFSDPTYGSLSLPPPQEHHARSPHHIPSPHQSRTPNSSQYY